MKSNDMRRLTHNNTIISSLYCNSKPKHKPKPQRSLPTDRCNNKMEQQSEVIGELQKSMSATESTDSGSEDSPINIIEINHEAYHSWDDSTIDVSIMIGTASVPAATLGSPQFNGSTIVEENNDGDTSKAPEEARTSWNVLQNKVRSWNERASKEPTEEEADRSLLFAPTFQDFVDGIAVSTIRSTQMGVESIKNLLPK